MVHSVFRNFSRECFPVFLGWNVCSGLIEKVFHLLGFWYPLFVNVLVEELSAGVLGALEAIKFDSPLFCDLVGRFDRFVGNGHEVHVHKVQCLFGAVHDFFPGQVAVKVHGPQTDGV